MKQDHDFPEPHVETVRAPGWYWIGAVILAWILADCVYMFARFMGHAVMKALGTALLVLVSVAVAYPQAAAPAPSRTVWAAAGGGYTTGTPSWSGIVSMGYQMTGNTYSYTTQSAGFSKGCVSSLVHNQPCGQITLRTGLATEVLSLSRGSVRFWTLADVGGVNNASGGISGAFSGRGVVIVRLPKLTNTYAAIDAGIVKLGSTSGPMAALLIGKTF